MSRTKAMTAHVRIVHNDGSGEVLVALCDAGLLGKTFKEGKLKLEVKTEFYGGQLSTIEDAMRVLAGASIANLVGEGVIGAAVRKGFVDPRTVIKFRGVPHVQMVRA